MGFFDKIKASVGIGGAELSIDCPQFLTSEQPFTAKVTVRGGKIEQKLNKLDLFFRIEAPPAEGDQPRQAPEDVPLQTPPNSVNAKIAPGAELRFEVPLEALATQRLYLDNAHRYAELMLEQRWVHFLPAAAGTLRSVSGLTVDALGTRLRAAGAEP